MKTQFINILKDPSGLNETSLTHCLQVTGKWEDGEYDVNGFTRLIYLGSVMGSDMFVGYKSHEPYHPFFYKGAKGSEFI